MCRLSVAERGLLIVAQHSSYTPENGSPAVVIPALADAHWWDYLLHTRRVRRLESKLLREGVAVVIVPWTLKELKPEAATATEAPTKKRPPGPGHRGQPRSRPRYTGASFSRL